MAARISRHPGSSKVTTALLAVDIGGTNIRCGVVETRQKKAADLSKASVWKSELWRHADDEPTREGAVKKLAGMLKGLLKDAEAEGFKLAPFIGVSCPGAINSDGSIEKGAQNLPGNWESSKFNLPASLVEAIPSIGDHDTAVLMHNDGVVQGLSEIPFMQDYKRWGILTIELASATHASPCAIRKRRRKGETFCPRCRKVVTERSGRKRDCVLTRAIGRRETIMMRSCKRAIRKAERGNAAITKKAFSPSVVPNIASLRTIRNRRRGVASEHVRRPDLIRSF